MEIKQFILQEEVKKIFLDFPQGSVRVLSINFVYNINIKMIQYNSVNVKLPDSQIDELKSATKK